MHTCAVCLQGTFFVHHEPAYLEILRDFLVEVAVGVPGALQHLLGLRQQRLSPSGMVGSTSTLWAGNRAVAVAVADAVAVAVAVVVAVVVSVAVAVAAAAAGQEETE